MKTAAKVFIIIGMVVGCSYIIPIIVGLIAMRKLDKARRKSDIRGISILTLLFCNVIAGVIMLCMKEEDI